LTIQNVSRRSGLSGPTLRYYEEVGPIPRDARSGYRRYDEQDLDTGQVLAGLRAMGVGIEDMRTYQSNRTLGRSESRPRRSSATCCSGTRRASSVRSRPSGSTSTTCVPRRRWWTARERGDTAAEAEASLRVNAIVPRLQEVLR